MRAPLETRVGIFILSALVIFMYMSFQTGAFRFDRFRYNNYLITLKDSAGLARKADVKIAGVKVGWVKKVTLIPDEEVLAQAQIMVLKEYALYTDAYAVVRQDGLLGPRYVELIPGNPLSHRLMSGDSLFKQSTEPVSLDELLVQFKQIATNVQSVSESFKEVIGGAIGKERLDGMVDNLFVATERISSFAQSLDQSMMRNSENIDVFLEVGGEIKRLANKLEQHILPSFQENFDRIAMVFDHSVERLSNKIENTGDALEEATIQTRDGMRTVSSIAEKINEGKGLIGKLVNDDESYRDLRVAIQGVKNYVTKLDRLHIVLDSHFESMHSRAENYKHEDAKGYFDMRIYPSHDHFYVLGLVSSEKGFVDRVDIDRKYYDVTSDKSCRDGLLVNAAELSPNELMPGDFLRQRINTYKRNTLKLDLQFGKVFGDLTLRFGLFEGLGGIGADINIPLCTDKFTWVTTFEAFDMRGWNRRDDRRPHLKWLNRMSFIGSMYMVFGADDFVSKYNKTVFFGAGMSFGDEDIKYLLSSVSGVSAVIND